MSNVHHLSPPDAGNLLNMAFAKARAIMEAAEKEDATNPDCPMGHVEREEGRAEAEIQPLIAQLGADAAIASAITHALVAHAGWVARHGERRGASGTEIPF